MYRAFGIGFSTVCLIATIDSIVSKPTNILDINDYFEFDSLQENEDFQVYGLLKPGSFYFNQNTKSFHFTLTNLKQEVDVIYKGEIPYEFKEGENLILTCYVPNIKNKSRIIAHAIATNHSMEVENWEGKNSLLNQKSSTLN